MSDSTDSSIKEGLYNADVFTRQAVMTESFPNKIPVDRIKCCLEVYKINVQRKIILKTFMNDAA